MQQLNDYFDHVAETQREILERFYTAAVENPCKALRCTNPLVSLYNIFNEESSPLFYFGRVNVF